MSDQQVRRVGLVFALALGLVSGVQAQTNLMNDNNPGFEEASLSPWKLGFNAGAPNTAATATLVTEGARSGNNAIKVDVLATTAENWHIQLVVPPFTVQPGSRYRLRFWAKGPTGFHIGFSDVEDNWNYIGGFSPAVTGTWKKFEGEFAATTQSGRNGIQIGFYLGSAKGTWYFDDFEIIQEPPLDTAAYNAWEKNAPARIDSLRKADMQFALKDSLGNPIVGAKIHARLVRHAFPFGTALAFSSSTNPTGDELWYRQTAAKLFNHAVFENDFKWPIFERKQGSPDTARIGRYLKWGDSVGIDFRGHALVWGIQQYGFGTFWGTDTAKLTCAQIAANIKARIDRDVKYYKGRIREYDVWNEAIHEPAFFAKCANNPEFAPDGLTIQDSAFVWAHRADSSARMYINDYANIDGSTNDAYYDQIKAMLDRKTPVEGIGVQAHLGGTVFDGALMKSRLDKLASLGLPIKVTEFDNDAFPNGGAFTEEEQAREYTRFMRFMFSHPSIHGIVMWGFWDNKHWNPTAGIYRSDLTPKPSADSLIHLWTKEWSTNDTVVTDASGNSRVRGFQGKYEILVTHNGKIWSTTTTLPAGGSTVPLQIGGEGSLVGLSTLANSQGLRIRTLPGALLLSSPKALRYRLGRVDGQESVSGKLTAGRAVRIPLRTGAWVLTSGGSLEKNSQLVVIP